MLSKSKVTAFSLKLAATLVRAVVMTNSEHSEGTIDADAMYRVPTNFSGPREGDAWRATHISREADVA